MYLLFASFVIPSPMEPKLQRADLIAIVDVEWQRVVSENPDTPRGIASFATLVTYEAKLRVRQTLRGSAPRFVYARYTRLINTSADWGSPFGGRSLAILHKDENDTYRHAFVREFAVKERAGETWVSVSDWCFGGIQFPKALPIAFADAKGEPSASDFIAWFRLDDLRKLIGVGVVPRL